MRRPIVNNSAPGEAVYEPFCGSGSTIVAAETTGRICLAMEIDPSYVDVTVRRWEQWSARTAICAVTGQSFKNIAAFQGSR
jgi:DNA modification methylase